MARDYSDRTWDDPYGERQLEDEELDYFSLRVLALEEITFDHDTRRI